MKKASLAALVFSFAGAIAAAPAFADTVLYNNAGPNTDTGSPLYAYGVYSASQDTTDSFTLASNATVTGANFMLWTYQNGVEGEPGFQVNWSIGTTPFGSDVGTGTNVTPTSTVYLNPIHLSVNDTSFWVYSVTISIPNTSLGPGEYWFTLDNTESSAADGLGFWDASYPASTVGTSTAYFGNSAVTAVPSQTFEILGSGSAPVPEGGSGLLYVMMAGTICLGCAVAVKRPLRCRQSSRL